MRKMNCPRCDKELIRLEPYLPGFYTFYCDDCKLEIEITDHEVLKQENAEQVEGWLHPHFDSNFTEDSKDEISRYYNIKEDKIMTNNLYSIMTEEELNDLLSNNPKEIENVIFEQPQDAEKVRREHEELTGKCFVEKQTADGTFRLKFDDRLKFDK